MKLYKTYFSNGNREEDLSILITFAGNLTVKKKTAISRQLTETMKNRGIIMNDAMTFLVTRCFSWEPSSNATVDFHPPYVYYKASGGDGMSVIKDSVFIQG